MNAVDDARGFDFHCHVDLDRDPAALVARCERQRIITLAVTTTPRAWSQNRIWTARSRYVFAALGLHPELVAERHSEAGLLEAGIREACFIGEVGLDGSPRHRKSFTLQQEVFRRTLDAAQKVGGRVLTIHSRAAASEVIEMIGRQTTPDKVLCILHWFSGTPAAAKTAVKSECYFSVNGQMLDNERGLVLVKSLPLNRLLTETDSPFAKEAGRASLPWDVLRTAERLATLRGIPSEEMNRTLAENARRVLDFAGGRRIEG
jgi:TatD DNase family protein